MNTTERDQSDVHGLSSALPATKLVIHRSGTDNLTTPMFALATASLGNVPQCPPSSGTHTWDAYVSTWAGWFHVAFLTGIVVPGPQLTSGTRPASLADRPVWRPRAAPSLWVPSTMSSRASCRLRSSPFARRLDLRRGRRARCLPRRRRLDGGEHPLHLLRADPDEPGCRPRILGAHQPAPDRPRPDHHGAVEERTGERGLPGCSPATTKSPSHA